jgi:hypothetical protein
MSLSQQQSPLTVFVNQLIALFDELVVVFPEERDVKMALEAIRGAKKINPRLILDLFYEHVWIDLSEAIRHEDLATVQQVARAKINTKFNEILPALAIFDTKWHLLSENNKKSIWAYLKVLCTLCNRIMNPPQLKPTTR